MIKKIWDTRIPTLLGIGLITFSVILTSVFIKNQTAFKSGAIATDSPQDITISNISDTSFVLSYITEESEIGTVSFGHSENLGVTEIEDIDRQKGKISPRKVHVTTFNKLVPNKKYFFAINAGQTTFLNNNSPFEVITGPAISGLTTSQAPIRGNIILSDGSIPGPMIAYLTIKGAQTLSTLVNNGSFTFNLDSLRSEDLSTYFQVDANSNIKITFVGDSLVTRVLSYYSQTNPLPSITLSKNYDFTLENVPVSSVSGGIGGFREIVTSLSSEQTATKSPINSVPKKDQGFTNPPASYPSATITPIPTPINSPTSTPTTILTNQTPQTGNLSILIIGILIFAIILVGLILFLLIHPKTSL